MKQSLNLKLGQRLKLTPRLQQAIHLLQLSSLDLEQEIQANLESNPFLEEQGENFLPEDHGAETVEIEENSALSFSDDSTVEQDTGYEAEEFSEGVTEDWLSRNEPRDLGALSERSTRIDVDTNQMLENVSDDYNLNDYLHEQVKQTPMDQKQSLIASVLIENLNDDGYLDIEPEDLFELFPANLQVSHSDYEKTLRLVQQFDPPGIAARDLKECLLMQLAVLYGDGDEIEDAEFIVNNHLQALSSRDLNKLVKQSGLNEQRLIAALNLIKSLDPKPAQKLSAQPATYIVPDLSVRKVKNKWLVELTNNYRNNLTLSPSYKTYLSSDGSSEDNIYFKQRFQEAKWFLQSLSQRNETILRVATEIVNHQVEFFEYGLSHMKPLTLKQVAEKLSVHESTISRATNQKYMLSPTGIFELKFFFSSQLENESGDNFSSTAIQAQIKQLISEESGSKPISDQRISDHFNSQGIHIARRTVAKYREQMHIPPSSQRKSLI